MKVKETAVGPGSDAVLRVLLDARKLYDGGIGTYTRTLARGLALRRDIRLTMIVSTGRSHDLSVEQFSGVDVIEDAARPYSLDEMVGLGRRIDWQRYDVFHVPHYTLPFGLGAAAVVTVHDLIQVHHPQRFWYPPVATYLIRSAVRRATRVLVDSHATMEDLKGLIRPQEAAKLHLVPVALDPFFMQDCEPALFLRKRFGLEGPFLLAVSSMDKPHKGVRDLVSAFAALQKRSRGGHAIAMRLVLVGPGSLGLRGLPAEVSALGEVDGEDLLNLYAGACALVVPSLAEGFCVPVLEAKAQGTPVIARPVGSVKELLGPGDVLCRDFSVEALGEALAHFMASPACFAVKDLEGSRARLRPYMLEHVVQQVVAVYRMAAGKGI